jgi:Domain of unknown function (DUF4386)
MKQYNQLAGLGALLLAVCLSGYALYELVLYPGAGFPTSDFAVIVTGANTLRVGHWLKFGYTLSLAMLVIGLYPRMRDTAPVLARLAALAGSSAVMLFLASGQLGLRILAIAEETYTTNPSEAITTILLRTVTIALLEAATFAVGWYALFVNIAGVQTRWLPRPLALVGIALGILYIADMFLPDSLRLVAPLASIAWSTCLAYIIWREEVTTGVPVQRGSSPDIN